MEHELSHKRALEIASEVQRAPDPEEFLSTVIDPTWKGGDYLDITRVARDLHAAGLDHDAVGLALDLDEWPTRHAILLGGPRIPRVLVNRFGEVRPNPGGRVRYSPRPGGYTEPREDLLVRDLRRALERLKKMGPPSAEVEALIEDIWRIEWKR